MFDVAPSELLILGTVALLVIPPKDLPKAMRVAGHWMGKARGVARQFRAGFDEMIRESELAEMEKRWAAENERIMREHPASPVMLPIAAKTAAAVEAEEGAAPTLTEMPVMTDLPAPSPPDPAKT